MKVVDGCWEFNSSQPGKYKESLCVFLMKMEFDKAGAQIVVVSFGSRDAAVQWRQETSCQYPILLDSERQVT